LVALPDEGSRARCAAVAATLRARGIAAEVAPEPVKYGKQIRHADRRGIPFVWFPPSAASAADGGGDSGADEVRDIRSGEQVPADAATWSPPAADLRVRLVDASSTQR
jgi:histidyl-tRNA synthetase